MEHAGRMVRTPDFALAPTDAPSPTIAQLKGLLEANRTGTPGNYTYSLSAATLSAPAFKSSLLLFLRTYLLGSAADGLQIRGAGEIQTPVSTQLVISGVCDVLAVSGAAVTVTFTDPVAGTTVAPRAVMLSLAITPPSGYRLKTSFPVLAGTLFDDNAGFVLTSPVWLLASEPYRDTARAIDVEFGLSLYAQVALSGPLQPVATLTGATGTRPVYGPVGLTTDASGRVPLLALAFLSAFRVTFPPNPFALDLAVTLRTRFVAPASVASEIAASAPLTIGAVGTWPIAGIVPATGPVTLSFAFATPQPATWSDVDLWQSSVSPSASLPAALRAASFALDAVAITVGGGPLAASALDLWLETSTPWSVPNASITLGSVAVHLRSSQPGVTSATLSGRAAVGAGAVPLRGMSTNGFAPPFTLALDPSAPVAPVPSVASLVAPAYPAWSNALPAAIANLGTDIAVTEYTVDVTSGSSVTSVGFESPPATTWPVLSGAVSLSLKQPIVRAIGGATPTAVIGAGVSFGGTPVGVTANVSGSSFATYAFSLAGPPRVVPTVANVLGQLGITALPADIVAIGTNYTFSALTLSAPASATTTSVGSVAAALDTTTAWPGFGLVSGQYYRSTAKPIAIRADGSQTGAQPASIRASASGTLVLAGQNVPFSLALPASGTSFVATVPTPVAFSTGGFTQALRGNGASTPGWLSAIGFTSGALTIDYGAHSLSAALGMPATISVDAGSSLTNASMSASATSAATSLCIAATWNDGHAPTAGYVCYPYTTFQNVPGDSPQWTLPIPTPPTPPSHPVDWTTIVAIGGAVIAVGAAGYGFANAARLYWCGGYEVRPAFGILAMREVAARKGILFVGAALVWVALAVKQYYATATPSGLATGLHDAEPSLTARDVGPAVFAAYPELSAEDCLTALLAAFPTADAPTMAAALQATGYAVGPVAITLHAHYASTTTTAAQMAAILTGAYSAVSAADMAGALAGAGYVGRDVAAVLVRLYPSATGTAPALAALLAAAYGSSLASSEMAAALAASGFGVVVSVPPLVSTYATRTLNQLAADVVAAYASTTPVSAMQLGIGLASAGATINSATPAILSALPATTPSQMSAVRSAAFESDVPAALATAQGRRAAGDSARAAAPAIRGAAPQITANALGGVLYGVFTPPALDPSSLALAIVAGFPSITSTSLAGAVVASFAPAVPTASELAAVMVAALPGITAVQAARGLKSTGYPADAALAGLLAAGFPPADARAAIEQVYFSGAIQAGLVTSYAGDLSVAANRAALVASGWLVCDGASYAVSAYPDLYEAILDSHGGDSTRFNVPDLRDRFVRGVNGTATYGGHPADPDTDTRTPAASGGASGNRVGSFQPQSTAAPRKSWITSSDGDHAHSFQHLTSDQEEAWSGSTDYMARNPNNSVSVSAAGAHGHAFAAGGGDAETAPKNRALYWIIKANNV